MARIESHRDLIVWQKGMELVELVYGLTRGTRRDYAQFVAIARGSLMELETYVMIAQRLGYASEPQLMDSLERITELSRMLTALRTAWPNLEPPSNQ